MEELRAIFPDTDAEVLDAVLAANGNNVEQTINALLEMQNPASNTATDALYGVPGAGAAGGNINVHDDEALARSLAQQEQDEELARRLEQEEREQVQAMQRQQQAADSDPGPTFRETKEKVVAGATALGETAKKKFKELYQAFQPKDGGASSTAANAPLARQQYNNLPEDDFEPLGVEDARLVGPGSGVGAVGNARPPPSNPAYPDPRGP